MERQNKITTGRMLDQAETCRRIYWMTPFSAAQAIIAGRLALKPTKIGRKNYYRPEDVDRLVEAYETLHGGCSLAHRDELNTAVGRMEKMAQGEAWAFAKNNRVVYLLAEAALGKRWVDEHFGAVD